ncbi:metal-dependent hydrolase [Hydrogenophaga sp. A37]|uniref:metal-dependent hydrolase n=1 Tax=Hydrogenophaga sp. A37 TaxID=1945864 RepID=UPI000984D55A|nr:metal-dependent hydrolase [Hydrogenophaga sp. A37]OOG80499.1 hydrolase [Hydrogenophaga sp. A37]
MDSLTQIALGSAVVVATMGRRTAVWKAAMWGAVAGTLPDLDAFIDHGDAMLNMVLHRGESHALFYLTLFAPLLAWLVAWVHGESALFRRWTLALWLALITHPLLDAMTLYGTQLLLPFTNHPYGVGSVFIIDLAYTLPLIVGTVAALRMKDLARGLRWNAMGLVLSTAYLAWGVGAQWQVERIARASLQQAGIEAEGLLVTPTPFNTVLWRLVATTPTQYHEGFYSFMDATPTVRWTAHPRGAELMTQHGQAERVARLAAFTHGFYRLAATPDGQLRITDLRMGQEPDYTFNFDLGPLSAVGSVPTQHMSQRPDVGPALSQLWTRLQGHDGPSPR